MPWRHQICIAECLYSPRRFALKCGQVRCPRRQNVHFRLTGVAQKRSCLTSFLFQSSQKDDNSFSFYTLSEPFVVHSIIPKLCSKIVKLKPREPPFWIVRSSLASGRDVISSIVICYQAIAHFRFSETLNFKTRLSVLNLSCENEFYCIAGE